MNRISKLLLLLSTLFVFSCAHHSKGLSHYDTDGDGQVTKKEWDMKHEKKFKKYDKNSDGVIGQDEMTKKKCEGKCKGKCKKGKCMKKGKCDKKKCKADYKSTKKCSKCGHSKKDCKESGKC